MPRPLGDELTELRDLAVRLAAEATTLVVDGLDGARASAETKSSPVDMVTAMDRASELLIVSAIRAARPGDGFIGEEGTDEPGTTGVRWLIDPIDGTTNYVYGQPGFAISIAAQYEGDTIVGVVQDCLTGEVFVAAQGHGATRNGSPIRCSNKGELATALVATGFGYDRDRRRRQAAVLIEVLPEIRDIRRRGAASIDLCWVACGRLDGYWEKGVGPWDVAAGGIVASEAGAIVSGLDGERPSPTILAAGPDLYPQLRALLERAGAASV